MSWITLRSDACFIFLAYVVHGQGCAGEESLRFCCLPRIGKLEEAQNELLSLHPDVVVLYTAFYSESKAKVSGGFGCSHMLMSAGPVRLAEEADRPNEGRGESGS